MIEAVEAYIENIIGLMIVTALAEMIMPESSFKKYARLITGLVIVAAVAEPALEIVYGNGFDFELREVYLSNDTDEQRRYVNDIYIKETEKTLYGIAEENGIEISGISIKRGQEKIDEIDVYIEPDHCLVERVLAYDEKDDGCSQCKESADAFRDTIMETTGLKNVNVAVLKE